MLGKLRRTQGRIVCFLFLLVSLNLCLIKVYTGHWFSSFQPFATFRWHIESPDSILPLSERQIQQIIDEFRLLKKSELTLADQNRIQLEAEIRLEIEKNSKKTLSLHFNWTLKDELPYFFRTGTLRPTALDHDRFSRLSIWPDQALHDRIVNQLMYIPSGYDRERLQQQNQLKKIYIHNPSYSFNIKDVPNGRIRFLQDRCPVDTCEVVRNRYEAPLADAIIFKVGRNC